MPLLIARCFIAVKYNVVAICRKVFYSRCYGSNSIKCRIFDFVTVQEEICNIAYDRHTCKQIAYKVYCHSERHFFFVLIAVVNPTEELRNTSHINRYIDNSYNRLNELYFCTLDLRLTCAVLRKHLQLSCRIKHTACDLH